MTRAAILDAARDCITRDRNSAYGEPEDGFALIAAHWSAHLGVPITPADVAVMMCLLKLARLKANPAHRDSWVDVAGYAACGGEIAASPPPGAWFPNSYTAIHRALVPAAARGAGQDGEAGLFPSGWTPETECRSAGEKTGADDV